MLDWKTTDQISGLENGCYIKTATDVSFNFELRSFKRRLCRLQHSTVFQFFATHVFVMLYIKLFWAAT